MRFKIGVRIRIHFPEGGVLVRGSLSWMHVVTWRKGTLGQVMVKG